FRSAAKPDDDCWQSRRQPCGEDQDGRSQDGDGGGPIGGALFCRRMRSGSREHLGKAWETFLMPCERFFPAGGVYCSGNPPGEHISPTGRGKRGRRPDLCCCPLSCFNPGRSLV